MKSSSDIILSIIVPVYNSELYLQNAIESILNQDITLDFEILLIDDGSTDKSVAICDQYAETDSRIKVFHIKNSGVSAARNVGIENSCGAWLYFVDSDDELFPSAFHSLVEGITDGTILCMAGYKVYDFNNNLEFQVDQRTSSTISIKDCLMQMYNPLYYYYQGFLWDKLFKASIIRDNGLRFDEGIFFNEDRLFTVNYLCNCTGSVFFTTSPVYKYYKRTTGAIASLERGFNARFVTDFDAQVKMYELITGKYADQDIVSMAKYGVIQSYTLIKSMIRKFDVQDKALDRHLDKKLKKTASSYYYKTKALTSYQRLKKIVKRIIKRR